MKKIIIKKNFYFNKKLKFEHQELKTLEVGVVLEKSDYKFLATGAFDATRSFVWFVGNNPQEMYWTNVIFNGISQKRKLLLHRTEINNWFRTGQQQKAIIVVKRIYQKRRKFKLEIVLAKRRRKVEKRQLLREREVTREIDRERKK